VPSSRQVDSTAAFFSLPSENKEALAMHKSGAAWRGYFSVGEEFTSGKVDQKEGLYLSKDNQAPKGSASKPLHGSNMWPVAEVEDWTPFPQADAFRDSIME